MVFQFELTFGHEKVVCDISLVSFGSVNITRSTLYLLLFLVRCRSERTSISRKGKSAFTLFLLLQNSGDLFDKRGFIIYDGDKLVNSTKYGVRTRSSLSNISNDFEIFLNYGIGKHLTLMS